MFVVTPFHAKNVKGSRLVSTSLKGATAPESSLVFSAHVGGRVVEDTKQVVCRNEWYKSHSALQQCVVGCAAWFSRTKKEMRQR